MLKPVIFIVGPTGSGKSKLALMLARKLKAEIVSADSMQVYRGMNIGTAKPTKVEQQLVPHHLLGSMTSRSECSVFKYRKLALKAIQNISKRGHLPMIVGGSGLYMKALIDGLDPRPGRKAQYRKTLNEMDTAKLYELLRKLNPRAAAKIHSNDKKRIIRALEIILPFTPTLVLPHQGGGENEAIFLSHQRRGKLETISLPPLSAKNRTDPSFGGREKARMGGESSAMSLRDYGFKPIMFGISRDRKELYGRIEKRVAQMFRAGWINEVKRLKKTGFSQTAGCAIGYKEILEYLQGQKDEDEMISEIKKRTRHLAKRQMTWFRKETRIRWFSLAGEKYSTVCRKILNVLQPSTNPGGSEETCSEPPGFGGNNIHAS